MKKTIGFCLLLFSLTTVFGQNDLTVKIIANSDGTKVYLRWAPQDYGSWIWGNGNGYILERITVSRDGVEYGPQAKADSYTILANNLMPLPESAWEPMANTDELAGIAAGAIYGENFTVSDPDTADIVDFYNTIKENQNRFGFSLFAADQSFEIAEAMGLAFIDMTAVPGEIYTYGVSFLGNTNSKNVTPGLVVLGVNDVTSLPTPQSFAGQTGDQIVNLSWSKEGLEGYYVSYVVEKSTDGVNFVSISDDPIINTSNADAPVSSIFFRDSLGENKVSYFYRVKGRTPFGILGPPSTVIEVIGKPAPLKIRPFVLSVKEIEEGSLTIDWGFDDTFNNQILGFEIYRSSTKDGEYDLISNRVRKNVRTFIDVSPIGLSYYKVKAVDVNEYRLSTFAAMGQLNDQVPPEVPETINCTCNDSGVVSINWTPSISDDVMGYRIFMSNQPDTEYSQVTSSWTADSIYQHQVSINTLTEEVYFKVVAIDYRENYSEFSNYCIAERPDIIPPSAPHLKRADPTLRGVVLEWGASSSSDVENHSVQRKRTDQIEWTSILDVTSESLDSILVDTSGSHLYTYNYRVVANDDDQNQSTSNILTVQPINNGIEGTLFSLGSSSPTPSPDFPNVNDLFVKWKFIGDPNLEDFLLYRKKDASSLYVYKTISAQEAFVEIREDGVLVFQTPESIEVGSSYGYGVIARYRDGRMSPMSNVITISN